MPAMYYVNPPPPLDPVSARIRRLVEERHRRAAAEFRAEVEANRRKQARARAAARPESVEERNAREAREFLAGVIFRRRAREVARTSEELLGMITEAEKIESPEGREAAAARMVGELDRLVRSVCR